MVLAKKSRRFWCRCNDDDEEGDDDDEEEEEEEEGANREEAFIFYAAKSASYDFYLFTLRKNQIFFSRVAF